MTGMTGNVPYYGGRFTPAQAYAAAHPHPTAVPDSAPPSPSPATAPRDPVALLDSLLESGVITDAEHQELRDHVRSDDRPVQVVVVEFDEPSFPGR